jgi:hypothetical protein
MLRPRQPGHGICSWGGGLPLRIRSMHAPADRRERGRVSQSPTPKVAGDTGTMREIGKRDQKKSRRPGGRSAVLGRARLSGRGWRRGTLLIGKTPIYPGGSSTRRRMPSSGRGLSEAYLDDLVSAATRTGRRAGCGNQGSSIRVFALDSDCFCVRRTNETYQVHAHSEHADSYVCRECRREAERSADVNGNRYVECTSQPSPANCKTLVARR